MKYIFIFLLSLTTAAAMAQDTLFNGGIEYWRGGEFAPGPGGHGGYKCCGLALAIPDGWGIPEQPMAMPTNQFVYKEVDSAFIHSGIFSARLATTTTIRDSAGDLANGIAVLVPGDVTCSGILAYGSMGLIGDLYKNIAYSTGAPYADTPHGIAFYLLMEHDVPDTATYAYVFTRWDSVDLREDTLAYHQVDIPDAHVPYGQWVRYADDIHYTQPGLPDTLHLIFYGGRNGDSTKVGNVTWLDDISFYNADSAGHTTGIIHLSADDAATVYPDPAATVLHVRIDEYMTGDNIELYDLTGSRVAQQALSAPLSSLTVSPLPDGVYLYRILDGNSSPVLSGRVAVSHE